MKSWGFLAMPTPEGVPLTMISPGFRVIASLRMRSGGDSEDHVVGGCALDHLAVEPGLDPQALASLVGSSSAVTNTGPKAPVPSKFLPTVHCGDLVWKSRIDASLKIE